MSDSPEDVFYVHGGLRRDLCEAETFAVLAESTDYAQQMNWDSVRTPHLFMSLLNLGDKGILAWVARLNGDSYQLYEQFRDMFYQDMPPSPPLQLHREFLSDNAIKVLREALNRARDNGRTQFSPMDLLISILTTQPSIVAECFERFGYSPGTISELAIQAEQEASMHGN